MDFRGGGHGRGGLAGGETDHAPLRGRGQMLRQHAIWMRGGDGGFENRTEQGA